MLRKLHYLTFTSNRNLSVDSVHTVRLRRHFNSADRTEQLFKPCISSKEVLLKSTQPPCTSTLPGRPCAIVRSEQWQAHGRICRCNNLSPCSRNDLALPASWLLWVRIVSCLGTERLLAVRAHLCPANEIFEASEHLHGLCSFLVCT